MAMKRASSLRTMAVLALILGLVLPAVQAQAPAPAPAATSDGTTVDQGIAYVLMLVALVLTYLIHPLSTSSSSSPVSNLF
ncbi:arabinogalactan peptide 16-like protein [Carex littledalei]|uniref:Arabinogalactan peptide 16-like protein n=1 Tax=Carex littledalei TaxID=544730 RepID=A0A833R0Q7_9POAL|nr:arabinogalactan peptide 16-like protein [Carex littledalei]